MRKSIILAVSAVLFFLNSPVFSQEPTNPEELSRNILAAADNRQAFSLLQQAKEDYLKNAKFNEFCGFLKTLPAKNKDLERPVEYLYSLTRYEQLKYLEEKQSWDEYFNKGNDYRQDITSGLDELLKSTAGKDPLQLYGRLLLWQFHHDQQDAFSGDSLEALLAAAKAYSSEGAQDLAPLKDVADKLQAYDQKAQARQVYKLYIDKLVNGDFKVEELQAMAAKFFQESNLELAETVYDAFIDKIAKSWAKDKAAGELARIAREFSYKDNLTNDPAYAEKVFQKLESFAGKEPFNEQLSYLRAFNLEKAKEFEPAKALYSDLLSRFPDSGYYDKINFKLGIINGYVSRDKKSARECFQKLAGKETTSPEIIASLYHLGLLAQWEGDLERAKANYLKLKEKAGSEFKSSLAMADDRLKEIQDNKPLEANIRNFLDVCFKEEYISSDMSKVGLKSSAYNLKKDQAFTMTSTATAPESGCMEITLSYGWFGDIGKATPAAEESSFTSSYSESGTKVIGLVVSTSGGVIDRAIDLVDVE